MTEMILSERDGAILTITLNQPDRRNPVSDQEMVDALCDAFQAADADLSVRCVILTGAGTAFSSGGDLKAMKAGIGLRVALPAQTRRNYKTGIQKLPLMFEALEVPVIVNGTESKKQFEVSKYTLPTFELKLDTNPNAAYKDTTRHKRETQGQ